MLRLHQLTIALPNDCLLLTHTYSELYRKQDKAESAYEEVEQMEITEPSAQPSNQQQSIADSANVVMNILTGTNEPSEPPSNQQQSNADSANVAIDDTTGTNGMKDFLILHAMDDADLARKVKEKMEHVLDVNIRPLVDVFGDVGLNHGQLSCIDSMMNEYRCIIFLVTPNFKLDKLHLYQGETTLVMDLMGVRRDQQHRFVPLLCDIKLSDLKVGWLSTLIPLYFTDSGMQQVPRLIENIRKMKL
ncbi:TIR domain-containing adapter molecule 2-like isoform X2 [Dreissena polymorpha]|uniref:TIR domain-containing adapter molecule 2-like isoform X2 n=1 Tax=Dreissena polymorpha TaxID=45954 RepID=UPI002264D3AD|nr:TIR domain-containing adapter molecule 2-like isoform X2 [Dreissena polymorpha]